MRNRVQISSDALRSYVDAIDEVFGGDVDFGQIVKTYEHAHDATPRHKVQFSNVRIRREAIRYTIAEDGFSFHELHRTVERNYPPSHAPFNRLTLAFSKKLENFEAAVALHFAYYNFVKRHNSFVALRAMAAESETFGRVGDLVEASWMTSELRTVIETGDIEGIEIECPAPECKIKTIFPAVGSLLG